MSAATDYIQLTHAASEIDGTIDEVYAARGSYGNLSLKIASKQDALTQSQLAAANSGITAAKLTADETALGEVINGGAAGTKNLLDCSLQSIKAVTQNSSYGFSWNGNVCTSTRGASFTINADNSITVEATNMLSEVWFKLTDFMYSAGSYVISGCPTNGSGSSYYIESDALNYRDIGNGVSFTINSTTTDSIYIVVKTGQTFEKTFYPMLCPKVLYDADPSYVPYAPAFTNIILTPALIEQVDSGAKNLFNATSGAQSVKGFTLTPNGDGTYTVGGTRTTSGAVWMLLGSISLEGNYFLSGAASNSCKLTATVDGIAQYDEGNGAELNGVISDNVYVNIPTSVSSLSGVIVKPMICTKAAWDVSHTFVPYCPSMAEMYEMIQALQNGTRSVPALAKAEPEEIRTEPEEVEPETGEEEMR